jgi:opacity protein-like surface antigen
MRNACLLLTVLSLLSLIAVAQNSNTPWWELYGGYQYTRAETGQVQDAVNLITDSNVPPLPRVDVGRHQNLNGWNVSLQENPASWWGGIIDFSGTYASKDVNLTQAAIAAGLIPPGSTATARIKPSLYTFAGGPQFTFRRKSIQPFVRIMVGCALARAPADLLVNKAVVLNSPEESNAAVALIGGGGADYVWKDYLSFRAAADYVRTYLFSETQNNFRISVGVNFRIGKK